MALDLVELFKDDFGTRGGYVSETQELSIRNTEIADETGSRVRIDDERDSAECGC